MLLLNQIVTYQRLTGVLNLAPPEDGGKLQILSKTEVLSQLSSKFKEITQSFNAAKIKERLLSMEQLSLEDDESPEIE